MCTAVNHATGLRGKLGGGMHGPASDLRCHTSTLVEYGFHPLNGCLYPLP